ncbi:MAG: hypothetical protein WC951_01805 [Bacteroidales bacterium]
MRRTILTLLLSSLGLMASLAQSQLGMNYQAVIRNAEGKIIANTKVGIQISILKESTTGEPVYTETFTPTTNEFGLINLVISKGQVVSGDYSSIDWSVADYFLKIELDAEGGTAYQEMGTSQLLSVPYANYAFNSASSWKDTEGNISTKNKVEIASDGKNLEAPLFEVKNAKGEIIFAVFENGVEIYLDEETGGRKTRGGFAISGRTTTKETKELINVTPNETTIYVDEPTAKTRGGFAISGRTTTKAGGEILLITPSLTQFYVDEATAKTRGGFAISGRTTTKAPVDLLNITPSLTQFYVDEAAAKTRGGFAISGRTTTKAPVDLLNITPSLTQFYVAEPSTKTRGGFAISGRTTTKEGEADILTVTPKLTQVFVEETTTKTRGGFAISGRTTTKESGLYDVFTVVPERTDVYLKPSNSKNSLPIGFGIHGLNDNSSESTEFFSISGAGTYVANPLAVAPTVKTGLITEIEQTSALGAGRVTDNGGADTEITVSGIVYHKNSVPTIENTNNLTPDVGGIISAGNSPDFNNLKMQNLTPSTTYKVRAFAINSDGLTSYGEPREFTTIRKVVKTITVKVTNDSETAITDATVTFINNDIQEDPIIRTTNASGSCTVELGNNNYTYKVEADEYYAYTLDNAYKPANNETIDVKLTSVHTQGNLVTFTVKDQDGVVVSGVSIKYVAIQTYEKYTNSAGVAKFNLGNFTEYWVTPPKGYEDIPMGTVNPETQSTVEITLTKQFKVTFRVKDPQGIPAATISGILEKGSEWVPFEGVNGIAEAFVPANEAVGKWAYNIESESDYFISGTIEIKTGDTEFETEVKLKSTQKEFTVKYRIVDNSNNPIEGAKVHLRADNIYNDVQYSNSEGEVTFTKVKAIIIPDEYYNLTIEKDEFGIHTDNYLEINHRSDEYNPENPGIFNVKEVVLLLTF